MTRLEAERKRRGWTQMTLGYRAGFTQAEVSMMENRRLTPAPERLQRLAKLLDVPVDDLLADVSAPE
jgi:transcriptional regulator with XRE-family HTH domain